MTTAIRPKIGSKPASVGRTVLPSALGMIAHAWTDIAGDLLR